MRREKRKTQRNSQRLTNWHNYIFYFVVVVVAAAAVVIIVVVVTAAVCTCDNYTHARTRTHLHISMFSIPDLKCFSLPTAGPPLETKVQEDKFLILTSEESSYGVPNPLLPKSLHNDKNYVISLSQLCRWTMIPQYSFAGRLTTPNLYDDTDGWAHRRKNLAWRYTQASRSVCVGR